MFEETDDARDLQAESMVSCNPPAGSWIQSCWTCQAGIYLSISGSWKLLYIKPIFCKAWLMVQPCVKMFIIQKSSPFRSISIWYKPHFCTVTHRQPTGETPVEVPKHLSPAASDLCQRLLEDEIIQSWVFLLSHGGTPIARWFMLWKILN